MVSKLFSLFLLVVFNVAAADKGKITKVLFIGNSYSYYNDLSQQFKDMGTIKFGEGAVETQMVSGAGLTLKRHWQKGRASDAIKTGGWDYVVLQEHSLLGNRLDHLLSKKGRPYKTGRFFKYARLFDEQIKTAGGKTVFFLTWSRKAQPQQQQHLTRAYMTIAKELNAIIAPVGLVWDKVRSNPKMNLYTPDGSHPRVLGSYLAASTIFATVFDTDTIGMSPKLYGHRLYSSGKRQPDKVMLSDIGAYQAQTVHQAVSQVRATLTKTQHD